MKKIFSSLCQKNQIALKQREIIYGLILKDFYSHLGERKSLWEKVNWEFHSKKNFSQWKLSCCLIQNDVTQTAYYKGKQIHISASALVQATFKILSDVP